MKILKQIKNSQQGALLLMSILIMSGMVTAASSFGVITISNLQQAILIDNGVRAYYSAESGIEDGLYELRKNDTEVARLDPLGALSNSGTWSRTANTTISQLTNNIDENDFWHIDLYDPDTSLAALSSPIKSLKLSWTGDGSEWIEFQITPWDAVTGALDAPSTQLFSAVPNPAIVNLQNVTNKLYRIRIKALYTNVTNMTITAYSELNAAGGSQVNIPGYITMFSTGTFSRANQVVRAQMPHRPPLSGQFGYVLFSEQDLIK
tara:strand:+ start:3622 stop:4410 length:789 start_codon:yes stop_codon:yes gene_type:complete